MDVNHPLGLGGVMRVSGKQRIPGSFQGEGFRREKLGQSPRAQSHSAVFQKMTPGVELDFFQAMDSWQTKDTVYRFISISSRLRRMFPATVKAAKSSIARPSGAGPIGSVAIFSASLGSLRYFPSPLRTAESGDRIHWARDSPTGKFQKPLAIHSSGDPPEVITYGRELGTLPRDRIIHCNQSKPRRPTHLAVRPSKTIEG